MTRAGVGQWVGSGDEGSEKGEGERWRRRAGERDDSGEEHIEGGGSWGNDPRTSIQPDGVVAMSIPTTKQMRSLVEASMSLSSLRVKTSGEGSG